MKIEPTSSLLINQTPDEGFFSASLKFVLQPGISSPGLFHFYAAITNEEGMFCNCWGMNRVIIYLSNEDGCGGRMPP